MSQRTGIRERVSGIGDRVLNLLFSLLLAAVVLCIAAGQARAQEALTTWRAGDVITYRTGCHDAEAMAEVGRGGVVARSAMMVQHRCFVTSAPLAAQLLEWISGPYVVNGIQGSVWRVRDAQGDIEYILLVDDSGPHQAAEAT